jgi:NitT/TauT family transport system substrate-binding protein
MENGYFEEENLTISLTNGGGADKVMTALVSGNADIGLMGPETVVYVHNQGKKDAPKVFAQLTQKDGAFLVSRVNEKDGFTLENLRGKDILAGREGGVPAMSFEYAMHEAGMTNGVDYTLNFGVQFNMMTPAFESGVSDYCTMFEPTANEYERQNKGYVVASMGELSGELPYTSFIALDSYLSENEETCLKFIRALKKGYDFIKNNDDETVANAIKNQFPSTDIISLKNSVKSYRAINAWVSDLKATESSFNRLQDIMEFAGELPSRFAFSKLATNSLVQKALG